MKLYLTLLLLLFCLETFSQEVKIIEATQNKDTEFFEYEDYDENERPIGELVFLKGCSWYCGGSVKSIKASSELEKSNDINYSPQNAHDFNKNTAWIEGKPDYGIGEYIEYTFYFSSKDGYNGKLGINKLLIANGYKKSIETWQNNSRIKQLKLFLNDKPYAVLNLLDSFEIQTIDIGEITFPLNKETKLKFEIAQVYEGSKYKDTALSLLMFDGFGVH
jgi:hypothetical protein